ncbi:MAG TPA: amidase [Chitinophagaceae bacterium]
MSQYIYKSAIELARLIREGKATSMGIVSEHIERIKNHNDKLNALISIFEVEALQEAATCDKEAKEGKFRGPLHGIPVTIKEQFWIKGKNSNTNFKMLKDFVAPEDAVIVDRIRKSGAIILGQTNVPRNLLDYQVSGDIYPEGKNPYNTDYSPGGSTGGGAAALAAGFTPLELGADFGGSVRVPSNFCGLYGLKPTEKTVPLYGNIPLPKKAKSFIVHMVQAGPLARDIGDLELLWKIIVGPHESDRNIPDINWKQSAKKSLSEYKIAWTDGWPGFETSSQIKTAIKSLADKLNTNGCYIEMRIPDDTLHIESLKTWAGIFPYVIAQGTPWFIRAIIKMQLYSNLLKGAKKEMPYITKPMNNAFKLDANHYGEMMHQKRLITQRWENFFSEYDFLICPVAFGPSFERTKTGSKLSYEGKEMIYLKYVWPYVACFNVSGNPVITIPLGLGKEGLPLGVQIVGKYWSEPELINFAKQVAKLTEGFVIPRDYNN